ncbi:MAG: phosphonate ABC transporter ATP-binding protein [Chloroflexi bacterium UTCFX4]|jgi:phosphonate transport system ATP-binding protein|nr:MAG: phosphonate ABC transporter ATP-binding protein [Chloroflexi bacterium UTCFX4]
MLRVEHLTKVFPNGTVALKDVTFQVPDGEFLAVIGLSGSGKSTLLRCINRLIEPTSGRIIWNDVDITALSQTEMRNVRRQIGFIFQQFNLVKRSTVITNVLTGRLGYVGTAQSLAHYFSKQDTERALNNLERLGLKEKAYVRADSLSGGQQQRVAIARALMQEPKMILADEPVASLDPVLSHSILKYLELLNKEDELTVLCSLHFLDLVHRYATHAIALKDGQVVFQGLPQEIDDAQFKAIYGQDAQRVSII